MKKILLILISLLFLAFKIGDIKVDYSVAAFAISICSNDLDLDGDNDIIVGHVYNFQTSWGGISILENDGSGFFDFPDSIYLYGGQTCINAVDLDSCGFPEIIGIKSDGNVIKAAILTNQNGNYNISTFPMSDNLDSYNVGDINNDSLTDIVFSAGWEQYWGVIFNNGNGSFSLPHIFDVSNSFPNTIVCGDLNSDDKDDIIMTGGIVKIWFNNWPNNFQIVNTNVYVDRLKIIDFDNDGDSDIVGYTSFTWGDYTNISFIENLGDSIKTIGPIVIQHKSTGDITISDFNNDSLPDILFIKNDMTGLQLITNEGNFELSIPKFISIMDIGEPSRRTTANDFDGNGYSDIAIIRCGGYPFQPNLIIIYNNGDGDFEEYPITVIKNQNINGEEMVSCYPNPFNNLLTFHFNFSKSENAEIIILDKTGKTIQTFAVDLQMEHLQIPTDHLKSGVYFYQLKTESGVIETRKLIKL